MLDLPLLLQFVILFHCHIKVEKVAPRPVELYEKSVCDPVSWWSGAAWKITGNQESEKLAASPLVIRR